MKKSKQYYTTLIILPLIALSIFKCSDENDVLAPYIGSPNLSSIVVEESSYSPKITWVGGYASVLGINKGKEAKLDSTLIWLVKAEGNNLNYPVKFGVLPQQTQDLTVQFGGTKIDSLNEDEDYTFWILKSEAWNQLSQLVGKSFFVNDSLDEDQIITYEDSVLISSSIFTVISKKLDVYINIEDISTFGQLGIINISETNSNKPIISWTITQTGVTDSAISVIGIAEGNQYSPSGTIWEVYSEVIENGSPVYGSLNNITSPLNVGDSISNTRAFVPFGMEGLERNKTYYVWIANDLWGGTGRLRFEPGYAYATFNTR